jgi:hypothetical protein
LRGFLKKENPGRNVKMLYILAAATIAFTYYAAELIKKQQEKILIPIKVDDRPISHRH